AGRSNNDPFTAPNRVLDDLQFLPRIGVESIVNRNSGTIGILECCCSTSISMSSALCRPRHSENYVGFRTMSRSSARDTADTRKHSLFLIGLYALPNIVQLSFSNASTLTMRQHCWCARHGLGLHTRSEKNRHGFP